MKVFLFVMVAFTVCGLALAQIRSRPTKSRTNRNRNEPVEQGRTLGLFGSLLGLGLNTIARPLTSFGYDEPIVASRPYRIGNVARPQVGSAQSDPYYGNAGGYGGYGGYGGFLSNIFGGYGSKPYNNYGGYQQQYLPQYGGFNGGYPLYNFGGYRPQAYRPQGIYNGFNVYPSYNGYGGQQAVFSGQQSGFGSQRPGLGGTTSFNSISATTTPSAAASRPEPSATGSQIDPAQAAQVANLLGQLLGSQLRPLLSQGGAVASDDPEDSPSRLIA